jgi:TPR repeat protein
MNRLVVAALVLAAISFGSFFAAWKVSQDPNDGSMEAVDVALFETLRRQVEGSDDRDARLRLADAYREGRGTKKDPAEAVRWYEDAARQGSAEAYYRLGLMQGAGEGLRIDYAKAAEKLRTAGNAGHAGALFELARLHFQGRGVPHDYAKAFDLYRRAADLGHPGAQYILGSMYEEGWTTKEDPVEAYKWYTLAARDPAGARAADPKFDPEAALQRLRNRLGRFQVEEGQARVQAWLARK